MKNLPPHNKMVEKWSHTSYKKRDFIVQKLKTCKVKRGRDTKDHQPQDAQNLLILWKVSRPAFVLDTQKEASQTIGTSGSHGPFLVENTNGAQNWVLPIGVKHLGLTTQLVIQYMFLHIRQQTILGPFSTRRIIIQILFDSKSAIQLFPHQTTLMPR